MEGSLLKNGILVVLVIIVLVLGVGAFSFYNQMQGQADQLKTQQQSYSTLNGSYNDLSGRYAALQLTNKELTESFEEMNVSYSSVVTKYEDLKNQSDSIDVKLGDFLESGAVIAYTYNIVANTSDNNTTSQVLTVTAYNVGKQDANNVVATCTFSSDNKTGMLTKVIPLVRSLGKGQVSWTFDAATTIDRVWVGPGN